MGASGVTATYLLATYLGGLATRLPQLSGPDWADLIADAITEGEYTVQRNLGTRFVPTHFVPEIQSGAETDLDQTSGPAEYEPYYQWPGTGPGDGFPRIKTRIRPLTKIISASLNMPGTLVTSFTFDPTWLRVDRKSNEIVIAPTGSNAIYALAYALGGLGWRTPQTLALDYWAGLTTTSPEFSKVKRLVALHSTLQLLPVLSSIMNPTAISSQSADGLSQTRQSGYTFSDLAERLEKDAETITNEILAAWDGPSFYVF